MWWRTRLGYLLWNCTEYEAARDVLKESVTIAETHGLAGSASILTLNYLYLVSIGLADYRAGEAYLRQSEALADPTRRLGVWHGVWGRIQFELGRGNARRAAESCAQAINAAFDSGMVYIQILSLIAQARGFAEFDTHDKVMANLQRVRRLAQSTCFAYLESEVMLIEAYSLFRHGDRERGTASLAVGLDQSRRTNCSYHLRWSSTLPYLCTEALSAGIEVEYVTDLVKKYRLRPLSIAIEQWPWSVRIYTIGGFEIHCDNQRVQFTGKAPRKPLALLKALIAFSGRNVAEERLMDALWPDEEANAARKSLDVTVLRLRKLLGSNETILVRDESIGLNPELCWTDVWAFEHRITQSEAADGEAGLSAAAAALALYRGNFLPAEVEEPWTIKARERMRAKFVRLVESFAKAEEAAGCWEKAVAHYLKGLEADDLVEAFHLGLMRCYRALGRPAEAMITYRRLRQTLSVVLGIGPSPAAEKLFRELQESSAARHS